MIREQNHIIKRQVINLELKSQNRSFYLQDIVSRTFRDKVIPVMEQYFDDISGPEELHRIDSLELDIGNIDINNIEYDLKTKIAEKLKEKLAKKIKTIPISRREHRYEQKDKTHATNVKQNDIKLLDYFIKKGRLPWWTKNSINISVVMKEQIKKSPRELKNIILNTVKTVTYIKRLIYQFPDKILYDIIKLFSPVVDYRFIVDLYKITKKALSKIGLTKLYGKRERRAELWFSIFYMIFLRNQEFTGEKEFADEFILNTAQRFDLNYADLKKHVYKTVNSLSKDAEKTDFDKKSNRNPEDRKRTNKIKGSKQTRKKEIKKPGIRIWRNNNVKTQLLKKSIEKKLKEQIEAMDNRKQTLDQKQKAEIVTQEPEEFKTKNEFFDEQYPETMFETDSYTGEHSNPEQKSDFSTEFSESDELYIDNAGIIIIWPYLINFFKRLGFTKNKKFVSTKKAEKGVLLLQYIVSEKKYNPEHVLLFNKILCGLDIDVPIDIKIKIGKKEQRECENLLESVIKNWSAIKGVNPSWLRQGFFQREGLLTKRDGNWLLRVENNAQDVLIDNIPWSINVVKLPWMQDILYVEWRT